MGSSGLTWSGLLKICCSLLGLYIQLSKAQKGFGPLPVNPKTGRKIIQIAVILPERQSHFWSLKKVKPSIQYGVDRINKFNPVLGHELVINSYDSKCSDTYGPLHAIDAYLNKKANILFGPACDYSMAPIGRLTPFWNIPMITAGALVVAFTDKSTYRTLTRIQGTYSKLGESLTYIFNSSFHWMQPCLIYSTRKGAPSRTKCHFIMEAIYTSARRPLKDKYPSLDIWYKNFDLREKVNYGTLLEEASLNCRSMYNFSLTLKIHVYASVRIMFS